MLIEVMIGPMIVSIKATGPDWRRLHLGKMNSGGRDDTGRYGPERNEADGTLWSVAGHAGSRSGKWLVVEICNLRLALVGSPVYP